MPIDYDTLLATSVDDDICAYDERACMRYALGAGFGSDPLDRHELPYVFEGAALRTVPTMAGSLVSTSFIMGCGWDYGRVLHGDEKLSLYRPLPPAARLLANRRVTAVYDLGEEEGASIAFETEMRLAKDDTVIFSVQRTLIARGDGGFGGPPPVPAARHAVPGREADLVCHLSTLPSQALLFRLADDLNPLHADLALARRAGFDRPILQSRCIYAIACRAILQTICGYDFTLIAGFDARFTGPVYPGETVTTLMWQERDVVSFRCLVEARKSVVVDNGKCTLAV